MPVNPFSTWRLHVAWIWWVCTRAARKANPYPNPNSHDHCLPSKWKCRRPTCVHTHLCN